MKKINYSIIIPTHNSTRLLPKLLNSIPRLKGVQVIVVDDHSTEVELEQTQRLFDRYDFYDKKLLINTGVNSAGAARNIGIDAADGRWILFADSDDYFTEKLGAILEKYVNASVDVVYYKVDGNGLTNRADILNRLISDEDIEQVRYKHVVPWGKIIDTKTLKENNIFFSEVPVSNDILFAAKVGYFARRVIFESMAGYYSFERVNSLTTQVHDISLQDIRLGEVLKKYQFLYERIGLGGIKKAGLSSLPVIKNAISTNGVAYGLKWYRRLWSAGGRMNLIATVIRKIRS